MAKTETNEKFEQFVDVLIKNGARCMWQITKSMLAKAGMPNMRTVECWMLKDGRFIIVQQWANCNGYDYYIQTQKNKIPECYAELGLKENVEENKAA